MKQESDQTMSKCLEEFKATLNEYEEKFKTAQVENKKLFEENMTNYHSKRQQLEDKFRKNLEVISGDAEEKINAKLSTAKSQLDIRISKIEDELLCFILCARILTLV